MNGRDLAFSDADVDSRRAEHGSDRELLAVPGYHADLKPLGFGGPCELLFGAPDRGELGYPFLGLLALRLVLRWHWHCQSLTLGQQLSSPNFVGRRAR